jgi:hypothetical protein
VAEAWPTCASNAGRRQSGPPSSVSWQSSRARCSSRRTHWRYATRCLRIDAALVGSPTGHALAVDAVRGVARGGLVLHLYASVPGRPAGNGRAGQLCSPRPGVEQTNIPADPNGLEVFYLMLVTTIVGFTTVFQVRAKAGRLSLRRWTAFVVALAVAAMRLRPRRRRLSRTSWNFEVAVPRLMPAVS